MALAMPDVQHRQRNPGPAKSGVTCPVAAAGRPRPPPGTGPSVPDGYREFMGRIFLILIAALVVVMVVSAIIATLHLLFVIALIAVLVIGTLRLSRGVRRRARR